MRLKLSDSRKRGLDMVDRYLYTDLRLPPFQLDVVILEFGQILKLQEELFAMG